MLSNLGLIRVLYFLSLFDMFLNEQPYSRDSFVLILYVKGLLTSLLSLDFKKNKIKYTNNPSKIKYGQRK
jgi:hypothetical protein